MYWQTKNNRYRYMKKREDRREVPKDATNKPTLISVMVLARKVGISLAKFNYLLERNSRQ